MFPLERLPRRAVWGFGGVQPPSNWSVIPENDTGVGDVLRQNAQDLPAVQPAIQALRQSGACYDDLCGKAAETNGLNLLAGLLAHPKGSNGRVPSPPQSVPWRACSDLGSFDQS